MKGGAKKNRGYVDWVDQRVENKEQNLLESDGLMSR